MFYAFLFVIVILSLVFAVDYVTIYIKLGINIGAGSVIAYIGLCINKNRENLIDVMVRQSRLTDNILTAMIIIFHWRILPKKLSCILVIVFLIKTMSISAWGQQMFDTNMNNMEKPSVSSNKNEKNLTFVQQYQKLLIEKKYEKALSIINEAGTEKVQEIIKQKPEICSDVIRCLVFSGMYFDIYLFLDRDKDALDKFEEIICSLSEEQRGMVLDHVITSRLILYSRLNRIDDFIK
jgi:hypothetical protein